MTITTHISSSPNTPPETLIKNFFKAVSHKKKKGGKKKIAINSGG